MVKYINNNYQNPCKPETDKKVKLNGNSEKIRTQRRNLPKESVEILKQWLFNHSHYPYPTENEKFKLIRATTLTDIQVSNWFINARRRILPKLNPDDFRISKQEKKVPGVCDQPATNDLKNSENQEWDPPVETEVEEDRSCTRDYDENSSTDSDEDSLDDYLSSNSGAESTISSPSTPGTLSPAPVEQRNTVNFQSFLQSQDFSSSNTSCNNGDRLNNSSASQDIQMVDNVYQNNGWNASREHYASHIDHKNSAITKTTSCSNDNNGNYVQRRFLELLIEATNYVEAQTLYVEENS